MLGKDPLLQSTSSVEIGQELRTADLESHTLLRAEISAHEGSLQWKPPTLGEVQALFPNFQILSFIGRGGMGAVYRAHQTSLNRTVAIKILPREVVEEADLRNRFTRETQALARLNHPQIVAIYDSGVTSTAQPYFVMEYVEGNDLQSLIREKALSPAESIRIVSDVCAGISFAHEKGVIHRDLKPANILVGVDGRAKVADFGLARYVESTEAGQAFSSRVIFGTAAYMAPEQHQLSAVDHRCDIYAIGILLYETISFTLPRGAYAPPSSFGRVGKRCDQIVTRAMQPLPERRYATARQMLLDLEVVAKAPMTLARYYPSSFVRVVAPVVVGILLIIALVSFGHAFWPRRVADLRPGPSQSPALLPGPTEAWQHWVPNPADFQPHTFTPDGEGHYVLRPAEGEQWLEIFCGPVLHDQALRVAFRVLQSGTAPSLQLRLRRTANADSYYSASAYVDNWICTRIAPNLRPYRLCKVLRDSPPPLNGFTRAEFRISGSTISIFEDGVLKSVNHDSQLISGQPALRIGGDILIEKIEWLDLSALSEP